jgi:hypothetical protein
VFVEFSTAIQDLLQGFWERFKQENEPVNKEQYTLLKRREENILN